MELSFLLSCFPLLPGHLQLSLSLDQGKLLNCKLLTKHWSLLLLPLLLLLDLVSFRHVHATPTAAFLDMSLIVPSITKPYPILTRVHISCGQLSDVTEGFCVHTAVFDAQRHGRPFALPAKHLPSHELCPSVCFITIVIGRHRLIGLAGIAPSNTMVLLLIL